MNTKSTPLSWLIIGGTGLVGRYLLTRLAMGGHDVSVVTRDARRVPGPARAIVADISLAGWLDAIDPAAYDHVVHMAYATSGVADYDRAVTVTSVRDTIEHFRGSSLKHFVLLGSMSVFGMELPAGKLDERMPRVPDCDYARNKIEAAGAAMGAGVGFPVSVLHPTGVYADGSKRLNMYAEILSQGYILLKEGGCGINNIVHADDVAAAIVAAANRELGGQAEEYIINGETISFADWLKAQEMDLGVADRIRLPAILAPVCRGPVRRMLAAVGLRAPITLPAYKAAMFERKAAFSSEKALAHFGWRASRRFTDVMAAKEQT
jgi:nucleoside-diphosphate-sugar epimerase